MPDDPDVDKTIIELPIDAALVVEAHRAGIDLPSTLEDALTQKLENCRAGHKPHEVREAIACLNAYIDEHGLPLEKLRSP